MQRQAIHQKLGLSLFQSFFISYLGVGLIVFIILGVMFLFHEIKDNARESKSQLQNEMGYVTDYFDKTYSSKIEGDLNFIDRSYSLNVFLSSDESEIPFTRSLAEQLFINFTKNSDGEYISARYIDAQGNEQVVTTGNKRVRFYGTLGNIPGDSFYAHLNTLFKRLKSANLGDTLIEGPFKYDGKNTFLIGKTKTDPEVDGLSGVIILHCDLKNYFNFLDHFKLFKEHELEVLSLDNRPLFIPRKESNVNTIDTDTSDFYSINRIVQMGSDNESFFKIKLNIESNSLLKDTEGAFGDAIGEVLFIILPVIGLIAYFISGYFSRPLIVLADNVDHFAKGDLSVRAKIKATGELGILVESFNNMAEELQKITVSRDDLQVEINKRKIAEEGLRKAYEDLKSIQVQLLQSEKMASIGQLAAGVAHEINNPVGFISNNVEIMQEYVGNYTKILRLVEIIKQQVADGNVETAKATVDELKVLEEEINLDYMTNDVNKLLEQSSRGLERIRKIVLDLKAFSREENTENLELIKIEEVMDSILSIVHSELKHKAELLKEYGETPLVRGNAQSLGQVYINLLVNAAQAIEEKGKIIIKTYCQNGHVCLDVSDTGKGIPGENLNKIFDPFFTTKPVGQGTGLGLSVSHEIIKKHGGEIKVTSKIGEGTTFTVTLPIKLTNS